MSTYARLKDLAVTIDRLEVEGLQLEIPGSFRRVSTLIRLRGGGASGVGEDVCYEAKDQHAFRAHAPGLRLAGTYTLDELSRHLATLELFPGPPAQEASRDYRRWAIESAALDLALAQAGTSLHDRLQIEPRPVRFVVSPRMGNPPTIDPIRRFREHRPEIEFKLDARSSWDEDLIAALAATGAVRCVDLKGAYHGTPVDQDPDPALYERLVSGLPDVWVEDPALTPLTEEALRPHRERITWDAPIHSLDDVLSLPFPPRCLNMKPSRFGALSSLFETYDHCRRHGIEMYGGGQFELGAGRGHIQYLASLFHADGPNDVSPTAYHLGGPRPGLPASPIDPRPAPTGFSWSEPRAEAAR